MKSIQFELRNDVLLRGTRPPYDVLYVSQAGDNTTSCWRLGFWERVKVLFTGRIWLQQAKQIDGNKLATARTDCPFAYVSPEG